MNRKERRAAAHKQRKLDRKAGFPIEKLQTTPTPAPVIAPAPPVVGPEPESGQHSAGPRPS
jgi:hypothetical protein